MRSGELVKSRLYINNLNIADILNKDYVLAMIGSTQLFIGSTETLYTSGDTYISIGDNGVEASWSAWKKVTTTAI